MKNNELFNKLKKSGLPVAYHHFSKSQAPPFLVYLVTSQSDYGADDINLLTKTNYRVELITDKKDLISENLIDNLLNFVEFEKSEVYINEEKIYQVSYDFTIIEKKEGN
ncbi:MAG: hypothetical protein RSA99_03955 [Oscillospiraceae bacterium]